MPRSFSLKGRSTTDTNVLFYHFLLTRNLSCKIKQKAEMMSKHRGKITVTGQTDRYQETPMTAQHKTSH